MNKRIRQKKKLTGYTFSKKDLWSLDSTMAKFCAEGVRQFINMKRHTYPGDLTPEKWEEVLKEIHWTLNSIATQFNNCPQPYDEDYNKRIADGLKLFAIYFCDMWD